MGVSHSARTLLQDPRYNVTENSVVTTFMSSESPDDHDLTKPQSLSIVDEHNNQGGKSGIGLKAFVQFLFS